MKSRSKTKIMNEPEVKVYARPFANPKDRQEFLMNLAIGTEFDMRNRALFEFYGKDLIAYKRENVTSKHRNEFLRILSKFMANILEDNCPPSWKQCQHPFWEEFIFTAFPHCMPITPNEKEVEIFLAQLRKFARWLDGRVGTSVYPIIDEMASDAFPQLKICEHLLNDLFLKDFPGLHLEGYKLEHDYEKIQLKFDQCKDRLNSIFEVTSKIEDTIVLTEFNTKRTYYIKGLPTKSIVPGIIMSGMIAKKRRDMAWTWFETEGIYPQRGKKYLKLVM